MIREEIDEITIQVEEEFPNDPALQQVHIAQRKIAKLAEKEGISVFEYFKRNAKKRAMAL